MYISGTLYGTSFFNTVPYPPTAPPLNDTVSAFNVFKTGEKFGLVAEVFGETFFKFDDDHIAELEKLIELIFIRTQPLIINNYLSIKLPKNSICYFVNKILQFSFLQEIFVIL